MQAIIMAAGLGTRLGPLTASLPKPLLELNGTTLLGRNLNALLKITEISEIIIVAGHLHEKIEQYLAEKHHSSKIRLIYNENYREGSALTVLKAEPFITTDFLLLNADHLFSSKAYRKVISCLNSITICSFRNRNPFEDEMKIAFNGNGLVELSKTAKRYDCGYAGLSAVSGEAAAEYFKMMRELIRTRGRQAVPENLILPLSEKGIKINECDLSRHCFLEIDTVEDYELAKTKMTLVEKEDQD